MPKSTPPDSNDLPSLESLSSDSLPSLESLSSGDLPSLDSLSSASLPSVDDLAAESEDDDDVIEVVNYGNEPEPVVVARAVAKAPPARASVIAPVLDTPILSQIDPRIKTVVTALIIVGLAFTGWHYSQPVAELRPLRPEASTMQAYGVAFGQPTAPKEIMQYTDFECVECAQFARLQEPGFIDRVVVPGYARFRVVVYASGNHANGLQAAMAAGCAEDQGKFWQMHDQLFRNQPRWYARETNRPRIVIDRLASDIGLDMGKYKRCMDSEAHLAQAQANRLAAENLGIEELPMFYESGASETMRPMNADSLLAHIRETTPPVAPSADPKRLVPPTSGTEFIVK